MSVDVSPWSLRPPERATPWPPSLHPLMPAPALSLPASVVSVPAVSRRSHCDQHYPVSRVTRCILCTLHCVIVLTCHCCYCTLWLVSQSPSPGRPGATIVAARLTQFPPAGPALSRSRSHFGQHYPVCLWPSVASALHPARHRQSPEHSVTTDTHATPCCSTNTAPERN